MPQPIITSAAWDDTVIGTRVNTVLNRLSSRLEISPALNDEIAELLGRSVAYSAVSHAPTATDMNALGVKLWNATSQILPSQLRDLQGQDLVFIARLRVLAALLVSMTKLDAMTFLKAAQASLKAGQAHLAMQCLERCSTHVDSSKVHDQDLKESRLAITYHLLRIQHAQAIDNADLADHFASKVVIEELCQSYDLCEKAGELFHDYGQQLVSKDSRAAVRWLDRALQVLEGVQDGALRDRLLTLRVSTTTAYIRLILTEANTDEHKRARELLDRLSNESGARHQPQIIGLELEILLAVKPVNRDLLEQLVARLCSSGIDNKSFVSIRTSIYKVCQQDRECGLLVITTIVQKVLQSDIPVTDCSSLIGDCTLFFTMILLQDNDDDNAVLTLAQTFDSVFDTLNTTLHPNTTAAIQSLLWKRLKASHTTAASMMLLSLLQHRLLQDCSTHNKRLILRHAIDNVLAVQDFDHADTLFTEISKLTPLEPTDHYLGYKVALGSNDMPLATTCLQALAVAGTEESLGLLYACSVEAQKTATRSSVIATLRAIVTQSTGNIVLLRCLIKLILEDGSDETILSLDRLAETADLCTSAASLSDGASRAMLTGDECSWWAKTTYNLGLRCFSNDDYTLTCTFLKACSTINKHLLEIEPLGHNECNTRIAVCHFVMAARLILIARKEETADLYVQARSAITIYFDHVRYIDKPDHAMTATLRRYELEAVIRTQRWDDLQHVIQQCLSSQDNILNDEQQTTTDNQQWDKLADLALIMHQELSHHSKEQWTSNAPDVLELMQRSINETWKKEKNIQKVARWLRTMFAIDQDVVRDGHGSQQVALKLLDQAANLASRIAQDDTEKYPSEELQWLASTGFNRGVDYYLAGDQNTAGKFFDAALELAGHAEDNGSLHASLAAKRALADSQT